MSVTLTADPPAVISRPGPIDHALRQFACVKRLGLAFKFRCDFSKIAVEIAMNIPSVNRPIKSINQ